MSRPSGTQTRQVKKVAAYVTPDLHERLKTRAKECKISLYRLIADLLEEAVP